ncbi:MAG: hypothetical protein R3C44_15925 [Chloroflexota bacterium]
MELEVPRRSRLASCLWIGITAIVIVSLLGTSFLAYFIARHDVGQSEEQLQAALAGSGEAAELLLRDGNAPVSDTTAPHCRQQRPTLPKSFQWNPPTIRLIALFL